MIAVTDDPNKRSLYDRAHDSHAALTVGGIVTAHTNGRAIDAATGGRIVGVAMEVGSSGELTEVELNGPGAGLSP